MKKVKNFARFYACLNSVQTVEKEGLKESLVSQFSAGRTTSLKEMYQEEYNAMCDSIDPKVNMKLREKVEIKKHRSAVLRRIQQLGVDTTDWNAVDTFCLNARIAGKKFYELTIDELEGMIPKLIAIAKKPRAKKTVETPDAGITNREVAFLMAIAPKNQLPN